MDMQYPFINLMFLHMAIVEEHVIIIRKTGNQG
jgi:hypothetical protein